MAKRGGRSGRKYVRDSIGRFATTGATARGGRLKTKSGKKRATQTVKAKTGSKPAGAIKGKIKRDPGAAKPAVAATAKPAVAKRRKAIPKDGTDITREIGRAKGNKRIKNLNQQIKEAGPNAAGLRLEKLKVQTRMPNKPRQRVQPTAKQLAKEASRNDAIRRRSAELRAQSGRLQRGQDAATGGKKSRAKAAAAKPTAANKISKSPRQLNKDEKIARDVMADKRFRSDRQRVTEMLKRGIKPGTDVGGLVANVRSKQGGGTTGRIKPTAAKPAAAKTAGRSKTDLQRMQQADRIMGKLAKRQKAVVDKAPSLNEGLKQIRRNNARAGRVNQSLASKGLLGKYNRLTAPADPIRMTPAGKGIPKTPRRAKKKSVTANSARATGKLARPVAKGNIRRTGGRLGPKNTIKPGPKSPRTKMNRAIDNVIKKGKALKGSAEKLRGVKKQADALRGRMLKEDKGRLSRALSKPSVTDKRSRDYGGRLTKGARGQDPATGGKKSRAKAAAAKPANLSARDAATARLKIKTATRRKLRADRSSVIPANPKARRVQGARIGSTVAKKARAKGNAPATIANRVKRKSAVNKANLKNIQRYEKTGARQGNQYQRALKRSATLDRAQNFLKTGKLPGKDNSIKAQRSFKAANARINANRAARQMSQKEKWAARAEKRRTQATKAEANAKRLRDANRKVGDNAFWTQPGLGKQRDKARAGLDKSFKELERAKKLRSRADNLERMSKRNKGDAASRQQLRRDKFDSRKISKGQTVNSTLYGPVKVLRVNKKTVTISLNGGKPFTEDKSRFREAL